VGARSASSASSSAPEAPQVAAGSGTSVPWGAIGVVTAVVLVLLLALLPAVVRLARRRRRLRAGRRGDPDPLWAELSDTARDLGYVWSPARSPRQVATWLGREAGGDREVTALALAVERARYAPTSPAATSLVGELEGIEQRLRSGRSGQVRLRARLFPASLGWRVPLPRRRR
jgi:hypothetical protein